MRLTALLCIIFILLTITCCNSSDWTKDYKIKSAEIIKVDKRHWGKGYFIETLTFEYEIDGKTYKNKFESDKKERSYTSTFSVGDSLIFKYRPDDPNDIKVIKSKRMKK